MARRWPNSGRGVDLIDMNRQWPGDVNGFSAPSRHAGLLFEGLFRPNADFGIDFHTVSSGMDGTAFHIADMSNPEIAEMAMLYPIDQIFDDTGGYGGILMNELTAAGIPAFTPELGKPRVLDPEMIARFVEGTMNVLKHHGIVAGPIGRTASDAGVFVANSNFPVVATHGGFVELLVAPGEAVEAGQIVAIQYDTFGDVVAEYPTAVAGEVMVRRTDATCEPGTIIMAILFQSEPAAEELVTRNDASARPRQAAGTAERMPPSRVDPPQTPGRKPWDATPKPRPLTSCARRSTAARAATRRPASIRPPPRSAPTTRPPATRRPRRSGRWRPRRSARDDPQRPTAGGDATESLRAAETRKGEEEVPRRGADAASAPPRAGARRKASGPATSGPTRATPRTRSRRRAAGRRRRRSREALPPERREVRLEQRQPVLAPEHLVADDVARRAEHAAAQRLVGVALDGLDRVSRPRPASAGSKPASARIAATVSSSATSRSSAQTARRKPCTSAPRSPPPAAWALTIAAEAGIGLVGQCRGWRLIGMPLARASRVRSCSRYFCFDGWRSLTSGVPTSAKTRKSCIGR